MELEDCGVAVREVSMTHFLYYYEELRDAEVEDISMYDDAIAAHYVYAISLYSNMLGKQLGSNNYTFWENCTSSDVQFSIRVV